MAGRLVSPNEMLGKAKETMLSGREPVTEKDWALLVNFVAANVVFSCEVPVCKILKMLYNIPLSDAYIEEIARYQAALKAKNN